MNLDQNLLLVSLIIDTIALLYMLNVHRDAILLEVRFYQIGIFFFVLSIYLQSFVYFYGSSIITYQDLVIYRSAFIFNALGLLLLFLMLYIPDLEFQYTRVGYFLGATAVFVLSAVINATSMQLIPGPNGPTIELTTLGLLFNSLTIIFLIITLVLRFRRIFTFLTVRDRNTGLIRSIQILILILFISLIDLIIENTYEVISIQFPNVLFSAILLYFIIIIGRYNHEIFLTEAKLEGIALLDVNNLKMLTGQSKESNIFEDTEKFLQGPFAAIFQSLNYSILSSYRLERISFGNLQFMLYLHGEYLIIYSVTEKNLLVDRILSTFSRMISHDLENSPEAYEEIIRKHYEKLIPYF